MNKLTFFTERIDRMRAAMVFDWVLCNLSSAHSLRTVPVDYNVCSL